MTATINPLIRARSEHCISRRDLAPEALNVLYRLKENNYLAYLVGGGVRDLLLGRAPKDFDVSTNATPKEIRKLFSNCVLIGRRFRLAHIIFGDATKRKIIETSTFRSPPTTGDGILQIDDNEFGSPQEDAFRRDFTINGLFYDIASFAVIDYVGGLADLEARVIRVIGDPETRFREDPVRMLRAIRFASRLQFTIEENSWNAITVCKSEIHKASRPRLLDEIYRLFKFGAGERAVRLLWQSGMLAEILPEIAAYLERAPQPETAPLWDYLRLAAERALESEAEIIALLFFPLLVEKLDLPPERMSFHDLQNSGQAVVDPFLDRYNVARRFRDLVRLIITMQYRFYSHSKRQRNFSRARFAMQSFFPAALKLFTISAAIHDNVNAEQIVRWQNLLTQYGGAPNSLNADGDSVIRHPRKRRRRRPRQPMHSDRDDLGYAEIPRILPSPIAVSE